MDSLFSPTHQAFLTNILEDATIPKFPPLQVNPCANVAVERYSTCPNAGTQLCSSCRLVSYCSKLCQKAHWKIHKIDCKNVLRTDSWKPIWVVEHRPPSFIGNETSEQEFANKRVEEFSIGVALWGNTPAVDLINLNNNEGDSSKDFKLAFAASGDLRNVLKTINSLPPGYSGHLKIVLNDCTPHVASRNVVLLLILSAIANETIAADVALHFWYSTFMPVEYRIRVSAAITQFLKAVIQGGDLTEWDLSSTSSMICNDAASLVPFFQHIIDPASNTEVRQAEYNRVRSAPTRRDYRDRMYSKLKPSHRVAFQEYRRFGIILPFGAINAHFNVANQSLFSFEGKWLQTDFADPLDGWDVKDIVAAGQTCGAQPEDIYGCLYFFLSQQLRTFARRLRKFKISFIMTTIDASQLAENVKRNGFKQYGIPASTRFDRVHVSNILDKNYVGIEKVISSWGPLLAQGHQAVIVGYFMNWVAAQEDGRASGAPPHVLRKIIQHMVKDGKAALPIPPPSGARVVSPSDMKKHYVEFETALYYAMSSIDYIYDNSRPFADYLDKQGISYVLGRQNLQLREKHTIVPHRIYGSLNGRCNSLPDFSEPNSWYYATAMLSGTGFERFVEFSRA